MLNFSTGVKMLIHFNFSLELFRNDFFHFLCLSPGLEPMPGSKIVAFYMCTGTIKKYNLEGFFFKRTYRLYSDFGAKKFLLFSCSI